MCVRIVLLFTALILAIPAWAEQCEPCGLYFRSYGDQLKLESVDEKTQPHTAAFSLMILGNVVMDAPAIGRAEGEMILADDHCLGVYSEGSDCTLVFNFQAKSAKIRQIGSCLFGTGAHADGTFQRTAKPERYLQ